MVDQKRLINQVSRRYVINLLRVYSLLPKTEFIPDTMTPQEITEHTQEVLRASVVFMHAILEDTLREIARVLLSKLSSDELDDIPLVGISFSGQPKKFLLGELDAHRGKTVDELINESLSEYLNKTSFNSISDITLLLEKLKVNKSELEKYFSTMAQSIDRRHQIVHHADMEFADNDWSICPISINEVKKWILGNGMFLGDLISMLGFAGSPLSEKSIHDDPELAKLKKKLLGLAQEADVFN